VTGGRWAIVVSVCVALALGALAVVRTCASPVAQVHKPDPELLECLTESLFATLFDPPPDGARETTVVFPIELAPN
jgi:hypothetical protein